MSEETSTNESTTEIVEDSAPQPEIGQPPVSNDVISGETQKPQIDTSELSREIETLKEALRKANKDAASHRVKATELDKLKADLEASKLSETEKLQKQLSDYQIRENELARQVQEERNQYALERAGRAVGISDPTALADAIRLVDLADLEHDEQGRPKNAEELMKQLVKTRAWLVAKQTSSAGATNPPRSQTSSNGQLSWDLIGKMNKEQYDARRTEITQWMASNMPR